MNFEELRRQVEDLIRSGQRPQAQKVLAALKTEKIPRARLRQMADLCRRAGSFKLGSQLLLPVIRPKVPLDQPATDSEIAVYAIILLGFGASIEALDLLETGSAQNAEISLAKAFALMNRWDYQNASQNLEHYLTLAGPTDYEQMIAKVNLAACWVALSNPKKAPQLIEQIIEETAQKQWALLHKNGLEIGAQWAIQCEDWDLARQRLLAAEQKSDHVSQADDFFIQKWKAVAELLRLGASEKTLSDLSKIQTEARNQGYWETVRDCDYYRAIITKDADLFLKVYFGSPYQSYRDRIRARFDFAGRQIPEAFDINWSAQKSQRIFDLGIGEELRLTYREDDRLSSDERTRVPADFGDAKIVPLKLPQIKPGLAIFKLLNALASDSYRPFGIGSLYAAVFPGEYFNPNSSPGRISFLLHRLREWFEKNHIPLQIEFANDGYRMFATAPYGFRIRERQRQDVRQQGAPAHYLVMLEKIKVRWPNESFVALQCAEFLQISERSARSMIKWALENEQLTRLGTGRSTRYEVKADCSQRVAGSG